MKPEFYIGYLEKAPSGVAAHIKKVSVGTGSAGVIFGLAFSLSTTGVCR